MRFMILVPSNKELEEGVLPDEKAFAAMGKFNEEMVKAGVMLAAEGLHATSKGARIKFLGGKTTVIDGPFTEFEGSDRRLLADPGEVEGRGDRLDEACAFRRRRGARDSPGFRGCGLRLERPHG